MEVHVQFPRIILNYEVSVGMEQKRAMTHILKIEKVMYYFHLH